MNRAKMRNLLTVLWGCPGRLIRKKFCIIMLTLSGLFALWFWCSTEQVLDQKEIYAEEQRQLKELVAQEKGKGYKAPYLDPYSPNIMKYEKEVEAIDCKTNEADWVQCGFSKCYITNYALSQYKNVQCTLKDIVYVNDDYYYLGEAVKILGGEVYTLNASDYVRVSCTASKVGSLGVLKTHWSGFLAGYRPVQQPQSTSPPASSLNVLMLLFDSVSRFKFMRRLPHSYKMLTEELSAIIMDSYNIVGCRTANALFPILSGRNYLEMPDARRNPYNRKRVDPEPFIFTLLKKYGYLTSFVEDFPYIAFFNYGYNGFDNMPTDHYSRPFFQDVDWFYNLYPGPSAKQRYCFGPKSEFQFLADYTYDLFKINRMKWCLTFSNLYSHDEDKISLVDEELAQFLLKFKEDGHLEDTLLFVMSDHGARFSDLRSTYQGQMEELNPFVSVILPERLKRERPDAVTNLLSNSKVLSTPYDIHATVLDALGLRAHMNLHIVPGAELARSLSWLEPVPATRSCPEAGILPRWCASTTWYDVPRTQPVYSRVGEELARHVDRATLHLRDKCAERRLQAISWVLARNVSGASDAYYQARIVMSPAEAMYEGYVIHKLNKDVLLINDWDVVRVNKYGDEPKCISSTYPYFNKYCYCITNKVNL